MMFVSGVAALRGASSGWMKLSPFSSPLVRNATRSNMFNKTIFRSTVVLVYCAVFQVNQPAIAAQKDATAFLQTMKKIVREEGGLLLILFRGHKKYCWDGTDTDSAAAAHY